jgi:glycosyltransferase involved in cell wall biosynthesis
MGTDHPPTRDDSVRLGWFRTVLGLACLLIPKKNVQPCLRAFKTLVDNGVRLTVHLHGDGPLKPVIARDIEQLGLTDVVHQHGFTPRAQVLNAMRASHLFLMPSAPETFGLVYLEAMASGCVVIGHKGWGIDGVVRDGVNGYVVSAPTEAEILSRIQGYLTASDRRSLHQASLKAAEAHTRDKAVANYHRLFAAEH